MDENTNTDYFCFYCPTCGYEAAGWGDLPEGFDPERFCECHAASTKWTLQPLTADGQKIGHARLRIGTREQIEAQAEALRTRVNLNARRDVAGHDCRKAATIQIERTY